MEQLLEKVQDVVYQVNQVVYGKREQICEMMAAFIGGGHILLEDIPGVGKTTLAVAFSRAIQLEYKRVQFTPDVLPSDLTGFSAYQRGREEFVYQPGNVFCNLLLADELNRTSPKTQSALLEVMEEQKVTVEGVTRNVPLPFLVIATQNPFGNAGTQMLPEAQIDRFMISLSIGSPDYESELEMAKDIDSGRRLERIRPVMDAEMLILLGMSVCVCYFRRRIQIGFSQKHIAAERAEYLECPFQVENRGVLPVTRVATKTCVVSVRGEIYSPLPDSIQLLIYIFRQLFFQGS